MFTLHVWFRLLCSTVLAQHTKHTRKNTKRKYRVGRSVNTRQVASLTLLKARTRKLQKNKTIVVRVIPRNTWEPTNASLGLQGNCYSTRKYTKKGIVFFGLESEIATRRYTMPIPRTTNDHTTQNEYVHATQKQCRQGTSFAQH